MEKLKQKKTINAIALLSALDMASCAKALQSNNTVKKKLVEKIVKSPKLPTAVICPAAIVWCARGVAEPVINKHF